MDNIEEIRKHISKGNIKKALEDLDKIFGASNQRDELTVLSSAYSNLEEKIRRGTIDYNLESLTRNKIVSAMIDLINGVHNPSKPLATKETEDKKESQNPTINITQNHSGSGDNVAGNKTVNK